MLTIQLWIAAEDDRIARIEQGLVPARPCRPIDQRSHDESSLPSKVSTKMLQALERTLAKFRADVASLSNW